MNRPTDTAFGRLQARLQIDTPLGAFLGEQRIALRSLTGIDVSSGLPAPSDSAPQQNKQP